MYEKLLKLNRIYSYSNKIFFPTKNVTLHQGDSTWDEIKNIFWMCKIVQLI